MGTRGRDSWIARRRTEFMTMGRRAATINRELSLRRRLLAEADAAD